MAIEIKGRQWYARLTVSKGKLMRFPLGVRVEGEAPASMFDDGDAAFEQSRGKARTAHDKVKAEIADRRNIEELTQRVIEAKTGSRIESVKLIDLQTAWVKIPRARENSKRYSSSVKAKLKRFIDFIQEKYPVVEDLDTLTREHVRAFMEAESQRGVAAKTWNDMLKLLRTAFRHLAPESDAYQKYLQTCPAKVVETVHRSPYSVDELNAILEAAKDDEFIRPLITVAMCTAMRRGDCCMLKWADVDMAQRFIRVKTTKTRQTVDIPIFPLLYDELKRLPHGGSDFVMPEAAEMYQCNPDGITLRVRNVLMKAGFIDEDTARRIEEQNLLPVLPENELRRKVRAEIKGAGCSDRKKERMRLVFDRYIGGDSIPQIVIDTGFSKGSVSGYLNELEEMVGASVIRRGGRVELPEVMRGELTAVREGGLRKASIRDFHSFRVTWVTLALTNDIPLEMVQKVTGHKTTEIVLKHYYRPGREDFRMALEKAMPSLLTNGEEQTPMQEVLEVLDQSNNKTAWKDIQKLKKLMASKS